MLDFLTQKSIAPVIGFVYVELGSEGVYIGTHIWREENPRAQWMNKAVKEKGREGKVDDKGYM